MAKGKSKSSKAWLTEHFRDEFVQRSWVDGYRSRATYKLIEINEKDKIIKKGQVIVDLGAAPGGWTQYAVDEVGETGKVIALDLLPIDPIEGAVSIEGDFQEQEVLDKLMLEIEQYDGIDLVICDISPNTSGIKAVDQPRRMYLIELAYDFAINNLKKNGTFLCKVFQGTGFDDILKSSRADFKKVVIRKPKASRMRSIETYLLAKELKVKG